MYRFNAGCTSAVFAALLSLAVPLSHAAQVSAGSGHSLWVKNDGSLHSWGRNSNAQLGRLDGPEFRVGSGNDWAKVAAGDVHSMAIKSDGSLWAWGGNDQGQLGLGNLAPVSLPTRVGPDSDWTAVVADYRHTLALKSDGSLWAWGSNNSGQLGDGTTVRRLAPIRIGMDTNWTAVDLNFDTSFGRKADGSLWSWGSNDVRQLGRAAGLAEPLPGQVTALASVIAMGAGNGTVFAIKSDGTLWSWGFGLADMLGDGTSANRATPTQVGIDSDWTAVDAGYGIAAALKTDGSLWAWGAYAAQIDESSSLVPIRVRQGSVWAGLSVGPSHAMVVAPDGTAHAWGMNEGRLGVPAGAGIDTVYQSNLLVVPGKPIPAITLTSSTNTSSLGEDVTFTAARLPGGYPITGSVSLFDGNQPLVDCQEIPLSGTGATCTIANLPKGRQVVRAVFNGSSAHNPSLSYAVLHFVGPFAVNVTRTGNGLGSVTSVPAGIDCGESCSAILPGGAIVRLIAAAQAGSVLVQWTGCQANGANCYLYELSDDAAVTADFRIARALSVTNAPRAGGSVTGTVGCAAATCSFTLGDGTVQTLNAKAKSNWQFVGWSGDCSGSTCTLAMDGNKQVTANFDPVLRIVKSGAGTGTVASRSAGIDCGTTCFAAYPLGTAVTLIATPAPGSSFEGWSAAGCVGTGPCTVTMGAAMILTATFGNGFDLTVAKLGLGSGLVTGPGISCGADCVEHAAVGAQVTLTAAATPGSTFAGWSGDCAGTGACVLTMDSAHAVAARFDANAVPTLAKPYDFNADGRADILWRDADGQVALWLMDGASVTGSALIFGPSSGWRVTHADGDFNGDGRADLLWRHDDGSVAAWLMDGTTALETRLLFSSNGWSATHLLDSDGDGRSDILFRHLDGRIAHWQMEGLDVAVSAVLPPETFQSTNPLAWTVTHVGRFHAASSMSAVLRYEDGRIAIGPVGIRALIVNVPAGLEPNLLATHAADFNGDGLTDLLLRDETTGAVTIMLTQGTAASVFQGGSGWTVSHAADLDGDGRADLVWRHDDGSVAAWMMDGLAVTASGVLFGPGSWRIQDVRDFDGDTRADFLWRNTATGEIALWMMNGLTVASSAVVFGGGGGWVPAP